MQFSIAFIMTALMAIGVAALTNVQVKAFYDLDCDCTTTVTVTGGSTVTPPTAEGGGSGPSTTTSCTSAPTPEVTSPTLTGPVIITTPIVPSGPGYGGSDYPTPSVVGSVPVGGSASGYPPEGPGTTLTTTTGVPGQTPSVPGQGTGTSQSHTSTGSSGTATATVTHPSNGSSITQTATDTNHPSSTSPAAPSTTTAQAAAGYVRSSTGTIFLSLIGGAIMALVM